MLFRSVIRPGELQRMSAGRGVTHSEYNHSKTKSAHLLQIWILPEEKWLKPSYKQRSFADEVKDGTLRLVAAPDGRSGSVTVHQKVELFVARMRTGEEVTHRLKPGRHDWVQVARGEVALNNLAMKAGDGAAMRNEEKLAIEAKGEAEILLFDLA